MTKQNKIPICRISSQLSLKATDRPLRLWRSVKMSTEAFSLSTTTGELHCPWSHGLLYDHLAWLLHYLVTPCGNQHVTKTGGCLHSKSHFLIISSMLCNVEKGRYEQLFQWEAFGTECFGAWKTAHGSEDESGDDSAVSLWGIIKDEVHYKTNPEL